MRRLGLICAVLTVALLVMVECALAWSGEPEPDSAIGTRSRDLLLEASGDERSNR